MLKDLLFYDNKIVIFLNSLGSKPFDGFWLMVTNSVSWYWLFVFTAYLIFKSYATKKAIKLILIGVLACVVTLILVEFIKRNVARFRPIDNHEIKHLLRIVTKAENYSFVSGHSAFSMTFAYYFFKILQNKVRGIVFIFIFPLLFAYSRLYLGVHFLTDILSGFFLGCIIAYLSYSIAKKQKLLNPTNS